MTIRRLRRRLPVAAALAVMLAATSPFGPLAAEATDLGMHGRMDASVGARVTVTVALSAGRSGSFRMTGVPDRGRVDAKRTVANGTLRLTQKLSGARGLLVISSTHRCGRVAGRWRVASGTGSYQGASGGGTARGVLSCKRPWGSSTVVHAGTLTVPPPALAPAGAYGGWTPQDEWLEFEVTPTGRSVANLTVSGFTWECMSENGRFSMSSKRDRMSALFPIADDGTFAIQMFPNVTLSGRFRSGGAEGMITVREYSSTDAYGKPATCGGTIPWTASMPPPPPRRALPGTYCGRTRAGDSVCLDVLSGGREFRNLRVTAVLTCGDARFGLQLTFDETVVLGPTLKFEHRFSLPIPGGDPVNTNLRGSFDQAGATTGFLTLARSSFTHEGTRYTCSGGGATWTAQLQR